MLALEEEQGSPAPGAIERTLLDYAPRAGASQLVGSLVAAFVAEQMSADHSGMLLRFLPTESGVLTGACTCSVARARAPRACLSRAVSTTGKQLATAASGRRDLDHQ
jgi:hypothetical protein